MKVPPASGMTLPGSFQTLLASSLYILLAGCCFVLVVNSSDATFLKPVFFSIASMGILAALLTLALSEGRIRVPAGRIYPAYFVYLAACLMSLAMAYNRGIGIEQVIVVLECLVILYCSELVLEPRNTMVF